MKSLSDKIRDFLPLLVLALTIFNIYSVISFERRQVPQVQYIVATNQVPTSVSSSVDVPDLIETQLQDDFTPINKGSNQVYNFEYHYFKIGQVRHIKAYGVYYSEGSPTSYGIIKSIFPDRILLENGSILVNTRPASVNGVEPIRFDQVQLPVKDSISDDRDRIL